MKREECGDRKNDEDSKMPVWHGAETLGDMRILPLEVHDWLVEAMQGGFDDAPKVFTSLVSERRTG